MTGRPGGGDIIPPEWVGLPPPQRGTSPETKPPAVPPGRGVPPRGAIGSVIASASQAVLELVNPAAPERERGGCFIEPGRPCTGSGRCRQRGY